MSQTDRSGRIKPEQFTDRDLGSRSEQYTCHQIEQSSPIVTYSAHRNFQSTFSFSALPFSPSFHISLFRFIPFFVKLGLSLYSKNGAKTHVGAFRV